MSAWVAAHVTNDGDLPKKRTMNKATASTFSVSDVSPATTPLAEVPYKEAVEALLNTSVPERRSRSAMPRPVESLRAITGNSSRAFRSIPWSLRSTGRSWTTAALAVARYHLVDDLPGRCQPYQRERGRAAKPICPA